MKISSKENSHKNTGTLEYNGNSFLPISIKQLAKAILSSYENVSFCLLTCPQWKKSDKEKNKFVNGNYSYCTAKIVSLCSNPNIRVFVLQSCGEEIIIEELDDDCDQNIIEEVLKDWNKINGMIVVKVTDKNKKYLRKYASKN